LRLAPAPEQKTFATAEDAVAALIAAVGTDQPAALIAVLGPSAEKLVSSGDANADAIARKHFLDNYATKHALVADGPARMVLQVGADDWPLPLPIVQQDGRWHFDSAVVGGRMTGGFALVAWPATHRASGVMTFIVNQDGVVFQKDLGPETAKLAAAMTSFNPDLSWARVDIVDK
jgi:hypothetical protein